MRQADDRMPTAEVKRVALPSRNPGEPGTRRVPFGVDTHRLTKHTNGMGLWLPDVRSAWE